MKLKTILLTFLILLFTATAWAYPPIPKGVRTWLALEETPSSFTGHDGEYIKVNATADGLEFGTPPGGGDMTAAVWAEAAVPNSAIDTDAGGTNADSSAWTGVATISAGTWSAQAQLTHELGGLEADVSAYDGLVHITGGATSAKSISADGLSLIAAANYAAMREALDLEAGTDFYSIDAADAAFQPKDATLTSIAALGTAANKIAYTTDVDTWAEAAITAAGLAILDDANAETQRTTLGVAIGTNVQAQNATLQTIADASDVPGANLDIANTTNEDSIAADDKVIIYDTSAEANRSMTRGNFVSGIGAGQAIILDLADDGDNESTDLGEIAITNDTNSIFTESAADKLLIDCSKDWPKADQADVALTGDSATDFFSAGTIAEARIHADIMRDAEWTQGTTAAQGKLEVATNAEAAALVDTERAIVASALKYALENGTYDLSGATITFGLEAADIPDISATYETQLVNKAGLLAALSDVTLLLEELSQDTTPQLGGDLDLQANKILSTGSNDIIIKLPDNAGVREVKILDSDDTQVWGVDSDGNQYALPINNPYLYLNENDGTDYWIGIYDTTTDRVEVRRSATVNTNVDFYIDADGAYSAGNLNIATGHNYQINGTQINIGNLGAGGNWTPTGTLNLDSATLQNIGHGTIVDGSNYTTISNSADDDTIDELMAAIDSWAAGVEGGTFAALTDTNISTPSAGQIPIYDGSDSWDNKSLSGDAASLGADGALTLVAANLTTAGKIEVATAAETTTGTDAARAVSPDGLAGSRYGEECIAWTVVDSDTDVAVADGKQAFTVPSTLNGMDIVDVIASVHTKGVTGTTDVQLRRRRAGADADVLSTKVTIGDEFYAADEVVNAANDDLNTGDQLYVDVDAVHSGTAPKGLSVTVIARLP